MYDLIVIGGGPAGYHAAELAAKEGLKILLYEKINLGGVCLNEGCIPSKSLLYSAKIYDYAKGDGEKYGVTCKDVFFDYKVAMAHKNNVVKKLVSGVETRLKKAGVEIVRENAYINGKTASGFEVDAYQTRHLLICTGSSPIIPPIKGIENAMTNREVLALSEIPKSLAIIGGGAIGLEMASIFNSAGSNVTIYEMAEKIAGPFDHEISNELQKIYEKKGVAFKLGYSVNNITDLNAEKTLICVGRKPNTTGFGIENLNIPTDGWSILTDEHMKTGVPGVYAAGDVNGKYMLAHTAYREAEVAINNIVGRRDIMEYSAIPSIIYTNPEAAGIGETHESASVKGLKNLSETKIPMQYSGRYMAENADGTGMCKLVWSENRLIGAHMLGNPCSEIISTLSSILYREMSLEQIKKIVFPHPTVAEIIKEAVFHA